MSEALSSVKIEPSEEDGGAQPVNSSTKVDGDHEQEGLDLKRSLHHQAPGLPPVTPQDLQLHLQLQLLWKNSSLLPLRLLPPLALPGMPPPFPFSPFSPTAPQTFDQPPISSHLHPSLHQVCGHDHRDDDNDHDEDNQPPYMPFHQAAAAPIYPFRPPLMGPQASIAPALGILPPSTSFG